MVQVEARQGAPLFERQGVWGESLIYLLGVPWEGSVSFRRGTAAAPALIQSVSSQIDYYDPDCLALQKAPLYWEILSMPSEDLPALYESAVYKPVKAWVAEVLSLNRPFGLIGGDHSIPLAAHEVLSQRYPGYGVLHIDAHADLRPIYEGNPYSHATILYQLSRLPQISRLVAVGVRDWSPEEVQYARSLYPRLQVYEMRRLARAAFQGRLWTETASEIVSLLPAQVYVSIDVDALEVGYVPHTGTPVPGGFSYENLCFILETIVRSGRQIIAFDICETGGHELDAIVTVHLLYRLCGLVLCQGGGS